MAHRAFRAERLCALTPPFLPRNHRADRFAGRSERETLFVRPAASTQRRVADSPAKVLLSWSSGKDSAWALHVLREQRDVEVVGLLTTVNETHGRVAMHAVRRKLLAAQARAAGLSLTEVPIPIGCTNEQYDQAMSAALEVAKAAGITHAAFGDLFLEDIRRYREERLEGTGIDPVFPLWGIPTRDLISQMLDGGLRARITCVDPQQLDPKICGDEIDRAFVAALPPSVDPCGENGEFHSFAFAGPMFDHDIPIARGETVERDGFVFTDFNPA